MATTYAYLVDPNKQYMTKSGTVNVNGTLRVYDAATDDIVITYKDFNGTENEASIPLDNNGRAIVIADSARAYRLEVYDRYGSLQWTVSPLWCLAAGGGVNVHTTRVISTDGSIDVDQIDVGSTTTYDIGLAPGDSMEYLEWVKCKDENISNGTRYPTYAEGTMETSAGEGLLVGQSRFYHITSTLKVDPTGAGINYDTLSVSLIFNDGAEHELIRRDFDIDNSVNDPTLCEFSYDFACPGDGFIYIKVDGVNNFTQVDSEIQVHRIYSGINAVPGSCASKPWVENNFQGKLTAGSNIVIEGNTISATAEPQLQSNWDESDPSSVQYIQNKPQNLVQDANYVHTDNNYTDSDKSKLNGIEAGAEANVQADWNETNSSSDAYIQNKPDLSVYATDAELSAGLATKQDTLTAGQNITITNNVISATAASQEQADWKETDTSNVSYIKNKPDMSQYATQTDLAGKQDVLTAGQNITIQNNVISATAAAQEQSDWKETDTSNVSYIKNKPTVKPVVAGNNITITEGADSFVISATAAPQVQSDWSETATEDPSYIQNKPDLSVYATGAELTAGLATKQDVISDLATIRSGAAAGSTAVQASDLATVATTGDYDDLVNKPTIPTVDQSYSSSSTNAQSGTAVAQAIGGVDAVPDVTSSDSGKVLVANYSGGAGSYAWASIPPANAIILDSNSTWSDFHTPYSAGRKDIYYKHTNPYAPFDSRAELYLHLTAVSDVDGSSTNYTFALFEGAWNSGGVDYSVRCNFRYSGRPLVHYTSWKVDQSYSASSRSAQSGLAVAQAISAVNQVPASTSADADKVLTVDAQGVPGWATGGGSQVQSDWAEGDTSDPSYIQNKPDLSVYATTQDMNTALAGKQDVISDLETIRSGSSAGATAVQPSALATVATSGSYADLSNKPSIPTATSEITNDSGFITLSDVPAQVNADWTEADSNNPSYIQNKPIPKTLTAGDNISISEGVDTITISAAAGLPASTAADEGKCLVVGSNGGPEWGTGGKTYTGTDGVVVDNVNDTVGLEAPVDIVAGPGIVIDNPDGNTLRVRVDDAVTVLTNLSDIGTASVSNANWTSTYAVKSNNWVTMTFVFDPMAHSTVNSGTTIFVVKEGLRPSTNITVNFVVTNATGQGKVTLQPDGKVVWGSQYNIASTNSHSRVFTFTYPVAPSA